MLEERTWKAKSRDKRIIERRQIERRKKWKKRKTTDKNENRDVREQIGRED